MEPAGAPMAVVFHGLTWERYLAIERARGRDNRPRMAYLDGELEVMSPAPDHELIKALLRQYVEAFIDAKGRTLNNLGSTTFRKRAKQVGAEPDECYYFDKITKFPDLAIEIVHTSGGVDKLEIYRRLGVREVWFWIDGVIHVYRLWGERYRKLRRSLIRGLDVEDIARRVLRTNPDRQREAIRRYRRSLERSRVR